MFKEKPIFGHGFKTYRNESFKEKYTNNKIKVGSTHPHQIHFEILSELGIVGYILIMSNLLYLIFRKSKSDDDLYIFGKIFILASLVPILPSGSFFTSYGTTIFFINYSFLLKSYNLK